MFSKEWNRKEVIYGDIKEILVTDSVAPNGPTPKNINYLTASELIAEAIVRIQERKPVSPLFAYHKK